MAYSMKIGINTINYMSFETITHFLFSQNIGPSAAEDGPEFKRFQPPIWMVDAFSSTPIILTPTYLYFLCHWGNLSPMGNLENDGHHVSLIMPFFIYLINHIRKETHVKYLIKK